MLEKVIGDYNKFLENIFKNLEEFKIDVSTYELDHICYRVATLEEYHEKKGQLSEFGCLLVESEINSRNISTFKFYEPVIYLDREIFLIELPSPKRNINYPTGLEHVEFVTETDLRDFIAAFPAIDFDISNIIKPVNPEVRIAFPDGTSVKFHNESLEKVIEKEQEFQLI